MNTQTTLHNNKTLALKMAASGLPVFPCLEADGLAFDKDGNPKGAKSPYLGTGFKGATTDSETINQWWEKWPCAVVGLPTGLASGLAVIDGDIDKGTGEAIGEQQIAQMCLDRPGSVTVRTQSGGVQIIFKHVEDARTSSKQVATNVDIRGEGGYIIAPGSTMANGKNYAYEGRTLSEALTANDLPDFPLAQVQAAIAARKASKTDTASKVACEGENKATQTETLDFCRDMLATAPNDIGREDWVKLAASLRAEFGEALLSEFIQFSNRYSGSDCDDAAALHVWNSASPHTVSGIAPALALFKSAIGQDAFRDAWGRIFAKRDNPFEGFPFGLGQIGGASAAKNTAEGGPAHWPKPARNLLKQVTPKPPELPLSDVLEANAATWVEATAEGAGAPPDYVLAALLSSVSSIVGNARWVSPWRGWTEPPLIWSMCIGLPSAGKSPAIESVLSGVRRAEKPLRQAAQSEYEAWEGKVKLSKLVEQAWEAKSRKAMEKGTASPPLPDDADAGPAPHIPRLIVNDGTVEKIGVIAAAQPKGTMQFRDELAGWLLAMESRNGGSDRAFWLEAYGGRSFTVERMSRAPLSIERLTIGALGGIQPDRLNDLLMKASDDGLVARFMPIWPAPAPVKRPTRFAEDAIADAALGRLLALDMPTDEHGELRPWFATFEADAADLMDQWREQCRAWEKDTAGLLLSHVGKLPGLAARLALVLAAIDHAFDNAPQPNEITANHFGRACHFVETYALPMARRCYAAASVGEDERSARRLIETIQKEQWHSFTSRQVMRHERTALGTTKKLDPALKVLLEGDCIRQMEPPKDEAAGGRPVKAFEVNPAIFEAQQ